jgi:hypothetical protein
MSPRPGNRGPHFQRYAERRGEYDSALARIDRPPQR